MNDPGINLNVSGWVTPKGLEKAKSTNQVDSEIIKGFSSYPIPTFISVCPHCDNPVKWRTTGALPPYLTCSNCGLLFSISL